MISDFRDSFLHVRFIVEDGMQACHRCRISRLVHVCHCYRTARANWIARWSQGISTCILHDDNLRMEKIQVSWFIVGAAAIIDPNKRLAGSTPLFRPTARSTNIDGTLEIAPIEILVTGR